MPLGVLFMTTSHIIEVDVWETSFSLGKFIAVVVVGYIVLYSFCVVTKIPIDGTVSFISNPYTEAVLSEINYISLTYLVIY